MSGPSGWRAERQYDRILATAARAIERGLVQQEAAVRFVDELRALLPDLAAEASSPRDTARLRDAARALVAAELDPTVAQQVFAVAIAITMEAGEATPNLDIALAGAAVVGAELQMHELESAYAHGDFRTWLQIGQEIRKESG